MITNWDSLAMVECGGGHFLIETQVVSKVLHGAKKVVERLCYNLVTNESLGLIKAPFKSMNRDHLSS